MTKPMHSLKLVFLSLCFLASSITASAQNEPVDYLNQINDYLTQYTTEVWSYVSTASHSRSVKKVEKKRLELLSFNKEISAKLKKMPAFEDNTAFRDTVITFFDLAYAVLNEDYSKIMDMEAIAEQSFDLMEAYMMARKKAQDKIVAAGDDTQKAYMNFAKQHNITITEEENELEKKFNAANKVMDYHDEIYLIFFKSYKQDLYLVDALNMADIGAMEQNKNSLAQYANEGLIRLKQIGAFKGDKSLQIAATNILTFYNNEANEKTPLLIDYYLTKEKFTKIQTAFEAKKTKDRTQDDVDQYNDYINLLNKKTEVFNSTNNYLNAKRTELLDNYNKATANLLDKFVPK